MNINKRTVKSALIEHPGEFLTVKEIESSLGLNGDKAMRKISGCLSRLRRDADVERHKKSRAFAYCFKKSALHNAYSEAPRGKKVRGDSAKFTGFTFVEPLVETGEGFCELCEAYTKIAFKAEMESSIVFLCEAHGRAVDKTLCGYGGVFA
ncbi:MAG: hypothetical protein KAW47_00195 [Thermoplasmatales archaeon]|nr:hypothetical protein [Thermoplasmatales archaeon]